MDNSSLKVLRRIADRHGVKFRRTRRTGEYYFLDAQTFLPLKKVGGYDCAGALTIDAVKKILGRVAADDLYTYIKNL